MVRARLPASPAAGMRILVATVVLVSATVFAFTTDGGRRVRETRPLVGELDRIADAAGLGVYQLSIAGHRNTPDSDVFEALALQSRSILMVDTTAARERIERLPWVEHAQVRRLFPDEVRIDIVERTPAAVWRDGTALFVFDRTGRVLGRTAQGSHDELPLVAGAEAPAAAPALFDELARFPDIAERLVRSDRIGGRRWRLVLTGNRTVELPESGWTDALATLAQRHSWGRLLDKAFGVLDLRVSGRLVVGTTAVK
jgi:cell division protein FtsQ